MTKPSEWALREAQDVIPHLAMRTRRWTVDEEAELIQRTALALDAARRKGIEEAAQACDGFKRHIDEW